MNLNKLNDQIFLFTTDSIKELTLSFFRVQEYYESPLPELYRQQFNTFDFLKYSLNIDGTIDYFNYWTGFNIPGDIVNEWWEKQNIEHATPFEIKMFEQLSEAGIDYSQPYYIIGALESEKDVIKHEIAHALYSTNIDFYQEMNELVLQLKLENLDQYEIIKKRLLEMGYNKEVIDDEVQAYLSSEKKRYLEREFGVDYTKLSNKIKKLRKVLQKYNTFDF